MRIFQKQCRWLAAQGFETYLVVPQDEAAGAQIGGVHFVRSGRRARTRFERFFSAGPRAIWAAAKLGPGIVHLHDPDLMLWMWLLRLRGARVVFDMHELLAASLGAREWIPKVVRPLAAKCAALAERVLLRKTFVVFAEESYAVMLPWVRCGTVVRNSVLLRDLLQLRREEAAPLRVTYCGNVSIERGALLGVRVVAALRRAGIEAFYDCVGSCPGDVRARILEEARQNGVVDAVRLHGHVSPGDAWACVAGSALGLALLDDTVNYRDSLPTKVLEYMALGVPVLCSDFPLYKEVVKASGAGMCCDPRSTVDVEQAAIEMCSDARLRDEMRQAGLREVAARYDWAMTDGPRLNGFYEMVLRSEGL